MFNNIGGKIKALAKVFCWIGIIGCVITGIVVIVTGTQTASYMNYYASNVSGTAWVTGLLIMVIGSFISWIGSFLLYGFGELVFQTQQTAQNTKRTADALKHSTGDDWEPVSAPAQQPPYQQAQAYAPKQTQSAPDSFAAYAQMGSTAPQQQVNVPNFQYPQQGYPTQNPDNQSGYNTGRRRRIAQEYDGGGY